MIRKYVKCIEAFHRVVPDPWAKIAAERSHLPPMRPAALGALSPLARGGGGHGSGCGRRAARRARSACRGRVRVSDAAQLRARAHGRGGSRGSATAKSRGDCELMGRSRRRGVRAATAKSRNSSPRSSGSVLHTMRHGCVTTCRRRVAHQPLTPNLCPARHAALCALRSTLRPESMGPLPARR